MNPFPGLRSYESRESHLFFGRSEHIQEVRRKLESNHFVAIVGTSGTGKSSLIRAGVLPAIQSERTSAGDPTWVIASMKPGSTPILNLAKAVGTSLSGVDDRFVEWAIELMRESSLGLVQSMRGKLGPDQRLLILVDQFEEVFRFADENRHVEKDLYDHFVKVLIDTMRQRDVPIYVILTLRSDFLGDCVQFEGLPEAINDGHYLVPRMRMDQIREVITGPVTVANAKISPRLVQELINHLGDDPDHLPVLQHALMRGFEIWADQKVEGEPIDLKHLEAIGGLENALSRHADEAYEELSAKDKELAARIFKCLTLKTADNRGVRRPLTVNVLMNILACSKEDVIRCLAPFRAEGRSFVLPNSDVKINENSILDISHESLMRGWDRLSDWATEEMESAEMYLRICDAAELYNRKESGLWRDPELQLALDWKSQQKPTAEWAVLYREAFADAMNFLEESQTEAYAERRKRKKRILYIRTAVAAFLIIVTILSGWALFQTEVANEKSVEAIANADRALEEKDRAEQEKAKAVDASEQAENARRLAEEQTQLAREQKAIADIQKQKAQSAALLAEREQRKALEQKGIAEVKTQEALAQKLKADSASQESFKLRMISLSNNLAYESMQVPNDPELASLLAIQAFELAGRFNGDQNNSNLYEAAASANTLIDAQYSSQIARTSENVLALSSDKDGLIWLAKDGVLATLDPVADNAQVNELLNLDEQGFNTAYINKYNGQVFTGLETFNIEQYTGNSAEPLRSLSGHHGLVRSMVFGLKDGCIASAGRDSLLIVWKDGVAYSELDLGSRVRAITATPGSEEIFAGCEDGNSYRCHWETAEKSLFASRPEARVEEIKCSSDGSYVVIGYSDGVSQVFNSKGKLIKELLGRGSVKFMEMDVTKDFLAVLTSTRVLSIYELSNLTKLPIEIQIPRPVNSMCYDTARDQIYLACNDNTLHAYPIYSGDLVAILRSKVSRKLSEEEWITFMGEDIPYSEYLNDLKSLNLR